MNEDRDPNGPLITVQDVYNVVREHLLALDKLWSDEDEADKNRPRKVHVIELIDGIKLRLVQRAEANMNRHVSAFERAAEKIMGKPPSPAARVAEKIMAPPEQASKSAMQTAMEEARARISRNIR